MVAVLETGALGACREKPSMAFPDANLPEVNSGKLLNLLAPAGGSQFGGPSMARPGACRRRYSDRLLGARRMAELAI